MCTSSVFFGQNKGFSKRDSNANKLLHIIHTHGIEMVDSSTQSFRVVIQVILIISSTLVGICLYISGTDEQVHKPRYE
jgi:hypothetical protein